MEALSVLEGERKRHQRWRESLRQKLGEVGRDVLSPLIPSLTSHLEKCLDEGDEWFREFETRLSLAFDTLISTAELIHPSPSILGASRANQLAGDPTDNLILASILDHSGNHPAETKIFLSENRNDYINGPANLALRTAGIAFFADPAKFLEWHDSRAES